MSPARQRQADATRRAILNSARTLFAREGFAVSVPAIAEHAGVAPQTVYAAFGNKRLLLLALLDVVDTQAGLATLIRALREASGDAPRQLALAVGYDRTLFERAGDLIGLAHAHRHAHPELAQFVAAGRERGVRGRRPLVQTWADVGALRQGLEVDEALDIFTALCAYDVYRMLVEEAGWPPDRYQEWVTATLREALLTQ